MSTTPKKRTAKRSPKDLKPKRPGVEDRPIHILMPYLLGLIALFLALCFMLGEDKLGFFGQLGGVLCGLLGGGAFGAPALLLIYAFFYRKAVRAGRQWYQFWFFLADLAFFGVMAAVFTAPEVSFAPVENYEAGVMLAGGGAVGGFLYACLMKSVGVFTAVAATLSVIVFTTFLFGSTPAEVVRNLLFPLRERAREDREDRRERQALDREDREARRIALAEERAARERELFRAEQQAKKEKKKTDVQMESGEDVTGAPGEDFLPDNEVHIRLPKEEEVVAEAKEFTAIEDMPNVPAPDVKAEIQALFADQPDGGEDTPAPADEDAPPADDDGAVPWDDDPAAEEDGTPKVKKRKLTPPEPEKPSYRFPPLSILPVGEPLSAGRQAEQEVTARKLVDTLASFGVRTSVGGISKGPRVTRYELQPQPGVRVRSIVNLTDDIALALAAGGVRIEAPIPGKEAVGIEVPNKSSDTVHLRNLLDTDFFRDSKSRLMTCLGQDVSGNSVYCDLAKMPHLLVAGTTGSGKSVTLHSMIVSILYHATPEEVQFILVDPKKVEMGKYNGIPHMLIPMLSDPKKAAGALNWAVIEMERRFILLEEMGARDITAYNELVKNDPDREKMTRIVIIIDELADLMMTARDEVETSICRIAQKARAAGLHLVIGTQRPSVDVVTGLIKANVPSRIALNVASQVDSRTIIDVVGAEKLLGNGDMLYAPVGAHKPIRVQGAFVDDRKIEEVCAFLRENAGGANYDESVSNIIEREAQKFNEKKKGGNLLMGEEPSSGSGLFADKDPLLEQAIDVAVRERKVSTSLLQRKLSLGFGRAARIIDMMAEMGVIGPFNGAKPRETVWTPEFWMEYKMRAHDERKDD